MPVCRLTEAPYPGGFRENLPVCHMIHTIADRVIQRIGVHIHHDIRPETQEEILGGIGDTNRKT